MASRGQEGRSYQMMERVAVQELMKKLKNHLGRSTMASVLEQVAISELN